MAYTMETTDDVGSSNDQYLADPGTYHCVITNIAEDQGPKGNPIDGFTVGLAVLDGTVAGQKDKQTNLCLFNPDSDKSEKMQEWARKKQTAFVIAAGLLNPNKLGGKVSIELSEAVGRQIVLTFENNEFEGKTRLQLCYANIYHPDDPRVAKVPKDAEALGIIPKDQRKPAGYFAPLMKKSDKKPDSRLSDDELGDL
jgi:hypothetical protein